MLRREWRWTRGRRGLSSPYDLAQVVKVVDGEGEDRGRNSGWAPGVPRGVMSELPEPEKGGSTCGRVMHRDAGGGNRFIHILAIRFCAYSTP